MAAEDDVLRVFREFNRYTGDGLPGEPINAPLPVGDPQSGPHSPKKSELRTVLLAVLSQTLGSLYKGVWAAPTAYLKGNLVEYNGTIWIADRDNTGVAPVEGDDWSLFLPGVTVADASITFSKLASGVPASVLQTYFPGVSTNVQSTGLSGTDGDSLMFYADVTSASAEANLSIVRVQKTADYAGGTAGNVKTASWTTLTVEDGPLDYHWAGLDQLVNYASAGENVARYSKAEKRGTGPTWAGCFDIEDRMPSGTAGGALGIEVTAKATGSDADSSRNGVNIALHRIPGAGTLNEWGRGFWTSTIPTELDNRFRMAYANTAPISYAVFFNDGDDAGTGEGGALLRDQGSLVRGVDLADATYSTNEAIRLATNHRIAFTADGAHYMRSTGTVVQVVGAPLQANLGLAFPSAGLVTGSAGSATGQYLSILIDGAVKKLALLNA
jgi:hypothetical protein